MVKPSDYAKNSPQEVRRMIREGKWDRPTSGMCEGYVQANLVVLSKDLAYDFLVFAQRNPKPCPILDVTEPGKTEPKLIAPGASIASDIPRYRIWKNGELADEVTDVTKYWRDDLVGFLTGCSFSFEGALLQSNIEVRHISCGCNVPMYITNIQCEPAGRLSGPMVVSMRPIPASLVPRAVLCTGRFPTVHGAPVHIGDPEAIGIRDINKPDFGDSVEIRPGELPVFWACGVTPQAVIMAARPDFAITHAPGHMFIADLRDNDYAVF
ncbi:MAG: putative hydro-lyase [Fretibacterium sp.]|nr:putative hydro-lyase [Fretibacterium sp.]